MEASPIYALPMSADEIVVSYRTAKFPTKQISILAQLNCTSNSKILDILCAAGAISGAQKTERKKRALRAAPYGKNQCRDWTPQEDERLLELYQDGLNYRQIGLILSRSDSAVGKRLRHLEEAYNICIHKGGGMTLHTQPQRSNRFWTPEEDAQIIHAREAEGRSFVAIGQSFALPANIVQNRYYYLRSLRASGSTACHGGTE